MKIFWVTYYELVNDLREKLTIIFLLVLPVVIVGSMALVMPDKKNLVFSIGGNMALFMMFFASMSTTASLVEKRQTGTLKRIFIMPLRPWEFLAGKSLEKIAQLAIMVAVMIGLLLLFGVTSKGSWLAFLLVILLFAVFAIALGIVISVLVKSLTAGILIAMAITNPLVALSGAWVPLDMIKKALGDWININPVYHALNAMNEVLIHGKTLVDVSLNIEVLLAYTLAAVIAAVLLYNTRILEGA